MADSAVRCAQRGRGARARAGARAAAAAAAREGSAHRDGAAARDGGADRAETGLPVAAAGTPARHDDPDGHAGCAGTAGRRCRLAGPRAATVEAESEHSAEPHDAHRPGARADRDARRSRAATVHADLRCGGSCFPDTAVQLFTPTQPEPEPHTPTEPEADLFAPPAEAQRPPGYPLKPRARNVPGYRKVTPAPLPDPDGGPEERPDDDAAALAGQYPRAITHDETVTYSYDPDTDTFRAVVDADRPRVTRTDDSPPDGDARPVGGWHIKPTAQGVEAAEREERPQVPDDVAEELRERAEQEGGPVSMTTRRSFEHDLDTRETERVRAVDDRVERLVNKAKQRATPVTPGADARRLAAQMAKMQAEAKKQAAAKKPRRAASRKDDYRAPRRETFVIVNREP